MHSKTYQFIVLVLSLTFSWGCTQDAETIRKKQDFNENWRFILDDSSDFSSTSFDDASWRQLKLPHDWSIEGKFDENAAAGTGGGALPGGIGWYRKTFTLPASDSALNHYITFDGVYQNSEVYINEKLLGKRPNGYISFQYDLSPYLHYGEQSNVLAVRVDNADQPNSRWYSGSGIYRNVYLERTHPIHVDLWGAQISTPKVSDEEAQIEIEVTLVNNLNTNEHILLQTQIVNPSGEIVAVTETHLDLTGFSKKAVTQNITVSDPELWSIEKPNLYSAINNIYRDVELVDTYKSTFGIRYFEFTVDKGFFLNGKQVKINGVCNHHDLGALGAAVNKRAKERQLEILKEMGCNGIRTSHNPPSPELLTLCDEMGFIVQNETFDVWAKKKVENDYAKYWDEWHVKDLTDHLLRDRNHPSIFSWSIGNEILEQWDTTGVTIARELAGIVKQYAPDMPVTSGCNDPEPHNNIIKSGALDLIGFNYHHETFEDFPAKFKGQKFITTETVSSLNSRGEYDMPSDSIRRWPYRWDLPFYDGNPGNTCSSYDNCSAPWGSTHAETWKLMKKHDYLSGMYIWTGFDYLGEPTPYQWPSRSSYFGIIDLAGFPKDAYYMYQSEWTDKPVLHIFPHWNWNEGDKIDVWAYTNFNEVELFLNGASLGKKSKERDALKIVWNVDYEPGTLKAVGTNKNGERKEISVHTAGEPAMIKLEADRSNIKADGYDLSFVTVTILDKDGNMVPKADNLIDFEISDNLKIAGVDNGNQISMEPFKASHRKAFNGKCLVILQSKKESGMATLKATSKNLVSAQLKINIE